MCAILQLVSAPLNPKSPPKFHFLFLMYRCHAVEKMTRNSNALMRDGSAMADSDLVDFLSGPTDSAINFNGSADLHTPIHPPLKVVSRRLTS